MCWCAHTLLLSVSQMPHRTHPLLFVCLLELVWFCHAEKVWSTVIDYISQNGWSLMLVCLYRLVWTLHLVVSVLQLWWFSLLNHYHLSYIYTHQCQNKITPSSMSALINGEGWIHMNASLTRTFTRPLTWTLNILIIK